MRKVRLQAVVSSILADRLKEEADRRQTSVSALLAIAADQFLAPKKIPALPIKPSINNDLAAIKQEIALLKMATAQMQLQTVPPPAIHHEHVSLPRPAALRMDVRRG